MATLTGVSISSSYTSLLKLDGNTDSTAAGNGSNAIQVKTGDNEATPLFLNTDRLGIGGQPTQPIHIHHSSHAIALLESSGTDSASSVQFKNDARTYQIGVRGSVSDSFIIRDSTATTDRLTIDSSGNILFGTTNAFARMYLQSDVVDQTGLLIKHAPSSSSGASVAVFSADNSSATATNGVLRVHHENPPADTKLIQADTTASNTVKFSVDEDGDGYFFGSLGVGISDPDAYLAGTNNLVIGGTSGNHGLTIRSASDSSGQISFGDGDASTDAGYRGQIRYIHSSDSLQFITGSVSRMLMNSNGIGIGNTNPAYNLHITASSGNSAVLRIENDENKKIDITASDSNSVFIEASDTLPINIGHSSSTKLFIDTHANLGNVGIGGVTSPEYPIHVGGGDSALYLVGTTQGRVILQDSGATSGSQAFDIVSVADELKFRRLNDARSSVNATVMVLGGDNILPGADDAQDLGSSSKRFDDIHATNGTIQTSDERLKDNIADSSLGLDFVNLLRPVKYKWKDYTYDVEKEEAIEAKEAVYETVVVQEAVEAKEAVMGTRQKTVSKEVEKTKTEIVEEDGKYVQKEVSYTETVEEPQYEEVNLYDEDGNKIQRLVSEAIEAVEGVEYQEATYYTEDDELPEGKEVGDIKTEEIQAVEAVEAKDAVYEDVLHKIPVMEEYEVEPAVEAVEEITEERLVSEAIEAKDAVMETKEKTFVRTHFGLIAQEVEQVLKDSSLTNNDFAGLIYDEDADRYGIRYHELISPLIKAVQELSKKVTDLENK